MDYFVLSVCCCAWLPGVLMYVFIHGGVNCLNSVPYRCYMYVSRTTVSQDVQTWYSVQLAFAKFLSKIKENFWYSDSIIDTPLTQKFHFILDRNLAKPNCTENHVCTSCDTVVLGMYRSSPLVPLDSCLTAAACLSSAFSFAVSQASDLALLVGYLA